MPVQRYPHFFRHARQTLFVLAAVDGPAGQKRIEQVLLLVEQGAFPFVRRHGAPVGPGDIFQVDAIHFHVPVLRFNILMRAARDIIHPFAREIKAECADFHADGFRERFLSWADPEIHEPTFFPGRFRFSFPAVVFFSETAE